MTAAAAPVAGPLPPGWTSVTRSSAELAAAARPDAPPPMPWPRAYPSVGTTKRLADAFPSTAARLLSRARAVTASRDIRAGLQAPLEDARDAARDATRTVRTVRALVALTRAGWTYAGLAALGHVALAELLYAAGDAP